VRILVGTVLVLIGFTPFGLLPVGPGVIPLFNTVLAAIILLGSKMILYVETPVHVQVPRPTENNTKKISAAGFKGWK